MALYLANTSGISQPIQDMGITIAIAEVRDISLSPIDSIRRSTDLYTLLSTGTLKIIKDGIISSTNYLSAADAARMSSTLGGIDINLTTIAGLSQGTSKVIVSNGTDWVSSKLNLNDINSVLTTSLTSGNILYYNGTNFVNSAPNSTSGVQPNNANLTAIAALTQTTGNIIQSNGTNWLSTTLSVNDLGDAIITTPVSNQLLTYNGTNWVNSDPSSINGVGVIKQVLSGGIAATSATTVLAITTTPTSSSGTQIWSRAITTTNSSTRVELNMSTIYDFNTDDRYLSIVLLRDTTVISTFGAYQRHNGANGGPNLLTLSFIDTLPSTTGATYTYSVRIGVSNASTTWYIGQDSAGHTWGGKMISHYSLKEII